MLFLFHPLIASSVLFSFFLYVYCTSSPSLVSLLISSFISILTSSFFFYPPFFVFSSWGSFIAFSSSILWLPSFAFVHSLRRLITGGEGVKGWKGRSSLLGASTPLPALRVFMFVLFWEWISSTYSLIYSPGASKTLILSFLLMVSLLSTLTPFSRYTANYV